MGPISTRRDLMLRLDREISIIGRYFADARREFRNGELSGPQFFLLRHLRDYGEENISALADSLGLNQATISNVVISLVRLGYVTREKGEDDRRVREVAITPRGWKAVDEVEADRLSHFETLFAVLEEDELRELLRIMGRLTLSLRRDVTRGGNSCG
ncbi:MAG: MarR family winged helix-turn-helix transcriptional regulator [Clostridia bacterium]